MHKIKNTLNSSQSQSENALSTAFIPRTYKARDFRHRKRISFEKWAGTSIAPQVIGLSSLKKTISDLSRAQKRILELFIYMRSRGLPNWMSQDYIAKLLGYSRGHVNRSIQNLRAWGFIDIYNRGKDMSNIYKLANVFMEKHIWVELMSILPILRSFFLLFCLVQPVLNPYPPTFFWASKWYKPKNVTLLMLKEDKLINIQGNTREIDDRKREWILNLVSESEIKDEARKKRISRIEMKHENYTTTGLRSFKNMQKRVDVKSSANAARFLQQQTEFVSAEQKNRLALLESEKGTDKEAANNAKAADNLRRLFGKDFIQ